jgi:hypothetical protein
MVKQKKTDAPLMDTKTSAPPEAPDGSMASSIGDLVEATRLDSTGLKEVLSSSSPTDAIRQTITHPVVLAVVVGGLLMAFGGRRR